MKKIIPAALSMVLVSGLLTGCGYSADEDTLFILKNGKVVSTDVEEFDEETYDTDEFKEYVNQVISDYNESHGDKLVKLKKVKIKDSVATVILQYASAEDYMAFTSNHLFNGTISQAKENGFQFTGDFGLIDSGSAELCGADEFSDSDKYKVVILDEKDINVEIPGKIYYASVDYVSLLDKDKVNVAKGNNLLVNADESLADTESGTEAVFTTETSEIAEEAGSTESTESTESAADSDSVSDDDLLTTVEDAAASSSDEEYFEDDEEDSEGSSYIYIIYK